MKTALPIVIGICLALAQASANAQIDPDKKVKLEIKSQVLRDALVDWAQQTGIQYVSPQSQTANEVVTSDVKGTLTPKQALEKLLAGTPLTPQWVNRKTVAIHDATGSDSESENSSQESAAQSSKTIRIAEARGGESQVELPQNNSDAADTNTNVLVLGSHIRGEDPVGSSIVRLDRSAIEHSGRRTTEEVLNLLPQNFKNGDSEDGTFLSSGGTNATFGASANLRGLGSQSTLTLLNGQRLPSAGTSSFVDLSMIPASALQRVDVLLDSASAQYGSDAVGGVVNLVLRNDYTGAETAVQGGYATQGGGDELRIGQTLGGRVGPVSGLLAYEYYNRDPVLATQRDVVSSPLAGMHLLPQQRRQSALYSGTYDVTDRLALRSSGLYSERKTEVGTYTVGSLVPVTQQVDVKQYGATLAIDYRLSQSWRATLSGDFGRWSADMDTIQQNVAPSHARQKSALNSGEFDADGSVLDLPGGALKLAFGGGYRSEELKASANSDRSRRHLSYGFSEVLIPVVGSDNQMPLVHSLRLSGSVRYEDYSDFGNATSPRYGLEWEPLSGLRLRGSYGKAFRAPSLFNLDDSVEGKFLFGLPNGSGITRTLILFGNNANLTPETARTWNAGFDLTFSSLEGFRLSGTYYDIDYHDRIGAVPGNIFTLLTSPVFTPIVTRRAGASDPAFDSLVTYYLSRGAPPWVLSGCRVPLTPAGVCTEPVSGIGAIADLRLGNLSRTHTNGADVQVSYAHQFAIGDLDSSLSVGRIFGLDQRITSTSAETSPLGTLGNPTDLRIRAASTLVHGAFTISGAVNYSDSYVTARSPTGVPVASWVTVDLFAMYEFPRSGLQVSLAGQNILDRDPPRVGTGNSLVFGLLYDPANASPLGRFLSLEIKKTW